MKAEVTVITVQCVLLYHVCLFDALLSSSHYCSITPDARQCRYISCCYNSGLYPRPLVSFLARRFVCSSRSRLLSDLIRVEIPFHSSEPTALCSLFERFTYWTQNVTPFNQTHCEVCNEQIPFSLHFVLRQTPYVSYHLE